MLNYMPYIKILYSSISVAISVEVGEIFFLNKVESLFQLDKQDQKFENSVLPCLQSLKIMYSCEVRANNRVMFGSHLR